MYLIVTSKEKSVIITVIKRWLKINLKCSNSPLTINYIKTVKIEVLVSASSCYKLTVNSPYTQVSLSPTKTVIIKKNYFCWLLKNNIIK